MSNSVATPWTVVCQALLSMVFPRQEYWSVLPFPPPGDLPDSGIKPTSLASPALANRFFTTESPGKPAILIKLTNGVSAGPSTEHSGLVGFPELRDCCCFCCSFAHLCTTLCHRMDCSMPGLPVPHHLPEFVQVHFHCVSDAL